MASPFRLFRKYMKTLLVVFGVMIMFVFVIGDAMVGYLGGNRRGGGDAIRDGDATAVRWDGGSLTNDELHQLVVQRRILNAFIQGVEAAGRRAALEAGVEPRRLRVQPIVGPETPEQGVERSVVRTRLFAQAAREAGMRVSDATIVQYLYDLGRGTVTADQMRGMLTRLQSGGSGLTIDYIINALREEMLAYNYLVSHQFAFDTLTPQQRWDDWRSVNDRVVVEAAAIPIERFLVDVKEPTDAELADFFEKYKNRDPQPDIIAQMEFPSPHPGFRIPRKIDVQYIQANYDQYLAKIEDEITDAEIEKFYEENKDPRFIKASTDLFDAPGGLEGPADTEDTGAEDAATEDAATESDSTESEAAMTDPTTPPESTEPAATESSDAAPPPADDASPQTPDAPEQPATPPEATEEAAPSEGDQSSRGKMLGGRIRLAAFLQEADPANDPAADAERPAADSSAAAPERERDTANDETTTGENPDDEATNAATPPATTEAQAPPADASAPAAEEPPTEFQPLEEVREVIRRRLAEQRAADELNKLANEIASQLNAEFNTYFGQLIDAQDAEEEPPAPPPALADLAPIAEKHGLEHGRTGPVSMFELRETDVGKSADMQTGIELWRTLFGSRELEPYQPVVTVDIDGNRFVAMKMSETPGRVPELAEVKDEVTEAWKRAQAAELAEKYAQEQAKKAEEAGSMLAEFFAGETGVEVVRTDPFSKYTGGDVGIGPDGQFQQQPFRLSEPAGIVAAGPEFLDRVFELEEGQVAGVLSHDHTVAYVVRVVEHQDSPDELRAAYLAEANNWPGLQLMTGGHARMALSQLVSSIAEDAGLEWERPPDQPPQDDDEATG